MLHMKSEEKLAQYWPSPKPNVQKVTSIQLTEMKIQLKTDIYSLLENTHVWRALYARLEITQEQEPTSIHQIFINVILYNYIHWKT